MDTIDRKMCYNERICSATVTESYQLVGNSTSMRNAMVPITLMKRPIIDGLSSLGMKNNIVPTNNDVKRITKEISRILSACCARYNRNMFIVITSQYQTIRQPTLEVVEYDTPTSAVTNSEIPESSGIVTVYIMAPSSYD